jgi:AraC-like DNA-binding protein
MMGGRTRASYNGCGRVRTHVAFLGGPGVRYEEFLPPTPLRPWVAVGWRIQTERPFDLRIVPDGCMDLIRGDVIGAFTGPEVVRLEPGLRYGGLRFHPGGFPALFGVPASELVGMRVPLSEVAADGGDLLRLAREAQLPDPLARASAAALDVRELARESGYSERQLRRRVLAATGHGPKRMARIGRMQRLLKAGRGESWARTAVEHGFYDEAHMAADVRELAGATPHALMSVSS